MSTWTTSVRLLPLWTRVGVLMLGVSLVWVARASAQTPRAAGPFAGLFGGGARADNVQAVSVRSGVFGIWQDVVVPGDVDPALLSPLFRDQDLFAGANAALSYLYNRRTDGVNFSFDGTGTLSEYSVTPESPQPFFSLLTGLSTKLTRRITFNASGGASYSPYLNLFQGALNPTDLATAAAPGLANAAISSRNLNANAQAGISYGLSRRSELSVDVSYYATLLLDNPDSNIDSWASHFLYHYRVNSKISAHAGYFLGKAGIAGYRTVTQGLDLGVDYGDALKLQLSRRTVFTLSPSLSVAVSPIDGASHVTGTGRADLLHSFKRTWSSGVSYSRSLGYIPGFQDLVLSDSVTATLSGQLARRISSTTSAGWTTGQVGFGDTPASRYGALASSSFLSGLNIALARRIGAIVQYTYFKNEIPAGVSTLPIIPSFARQSVIVGLQFFAPLYNSQRARQ